MQLKYIKIKFEKPIVGLNDFYQRGTLITSIELNDEINAVFIRYSDKSCLRINLGVCKIEYMKYKEYDYEEEIIKKARIREHYDNWIKEVTK